MAATTFVLPPTFTQMGTRSKLLALKALTRGFRGLLPVLEIARQELGDIFQVNLPGFHSVFVAHPHGLRQVLVDERDAYLWRPHDDPVARLLRQGILVVDGEMHDRLQAILLPSNLPKHFVPRSQNIWQKVDCIIDTWKPGRTYNMFVEMRKIALIIFEHVYFSYDLLPEMGIIWRPLLKALHYISPGKWILTGVSDPPSEIATLDAHLFALIRQRRSHPHSSDDLITHLVQALDDDHLIRDQMLTMLIAGHDTSTAHLAWTLYLLGTHPAWQERVQRQIQDELKGAPPTPADVNRLTILDQVVKESLRLYPPIHVGNRFTARDVTLMGYYIPRGTRVMLSYYLVQRHPDYWDNPWDFRPERWQPDFRPAPFSYVPFGGGPRNCIGGAFARLEVRLVLARILQRVHLQLQNNKVSTSMGASLDPYPNVNMRVEVLQ